MVTYLTFGCACIASGFAVGGLAALIYSAAAISRSQERMQRKIREAWDQAWQFREECETRHGAGYGSRTHRETW
jgi:hypothetical protein